MSALFALGLLAGTAGATPNAYPATAVIDAFKSLCGNPASVDAIRTAARNNGWQEFTPAPTSNLGKLFATGKSMVPQVIPKGTTVELSAFVAFRKTVAGRDIEASTDSASTGVSGKMATVTGCQVYDFTAPAMLDDDNALDTWVGRGPDKKVDYPGQLTTWAWEGAPAGAATKLTVAFVPSTSPLANSVGLLGLILKSQHYTVGP